MHLINALEYPNILHGDLDLSTQALPAGQYAIAQQQGENVVLTRDPLGCNKLFYGLNGDGDLVAASRFSRAMELGVGLDDLASCPPGHVVEISPKGVETIDGAEIAASGTEDKFDIMAFRASVAQELEAAMARLKDQFPEARAAVCLSGGLDSSCVAALAKKHFDDIQAYSFSYVSSEDTQAYLKGAELSELASLSEDFIAALSVADALDISVMPVLRPQEAVLTALPTAMSLCQDWRDFNIHCAVVNLFLAQDLRAKFPAGDVLVLTGDLMNEYVCDYHEETIDGTVYYPQPRVPLEKLRRFFVRGLDAGDRELGIFNAFGLPTAQLFSAVAEHYLQVPPEFLERPDAKEELNAHLLPDAVRAVVNSSKRRAQVGGKDGGTLGIFHKAGLTQDALVKIWTKQLPAERRGENPTDIIQIGRYRTTPRMES